ncbi:MAG: hypothetical protein R3257_07070, partial [bacterium]|nr:hypothetical protein [bacterium]
IAAWDRVETGYKRGHTPDYIAKQIFEVLSDNPTITAQSGWKVDYFWIRENLVLPGLKHLKENQIQTDPRRVEPGNHALNI